MHDRRGEDTAPYRWLLRLLKPGFPTNLRSMRITKVDIPELPQIGLKRIQMEKLGPVVVLAGKNGAGKSRLLERLLVWTHQSLSVCGVPQSQFDAWLRTRVPLRQFVNKPLWKNPFVRSFVDTSWSGHSIDWSNLYDIDVEGEGTPTVVHFVPKKTELQDPTQLAPEKLIGCAKYVENIGVADLHKNALARIQAVQDEWREATHQNPTVPIELRDAAVKRYEDLNGLIERFLGRKLTRNLDRQAQLFDMSIGRGGLSDGQKILLQFCVAVHAQADKLSELIVLMDEPENHLHPGAMLDAITEIQKALTNGQLWIATHSVPLLAHFDPDCIWWMEDGSVQHVGSKPEMALRGLLGDDERIGKLGDFLGLPAALAATNFAHQCLLPPTVVSTTTDAQSQQIQRILNAHRPGETLRLLDFGAGRGRLVSSLREGGPNAEEVKARFDYRAYDALSEHRVECESAIARLYGTADKRYFTEEKDLVAELQAGSVDVVVMCNVLHEIDTEHWLPLFAEQGLLRRLLRPDGFLLLVEDMEMRIGEKAHQRGFLVLDTAELKTFFRIKEQEAGFAVDDARKDGRLKAHLVPARCLAQACHDTKLEALKQVKHFAKGEIKKLRKEPANYANGRKHAFHVQQLANAELALELAGS